MQIEIENQSNIHAASKKIHVQTSKHQREDLTINSGKFSSFRGQLGIINEVHFLVNRYLHYYICEYKLPVQKSSMIKKEGTDSTLKHLSSELISIHLP